MKRTALHRASLQGHTEVVEKLLKHGADINFKDQVSPRRDCARLSSHAKAAASVCLESVLFIGAGSTSCVFQLGSRAIHWACRGGSLEVIKALRSHGADLNVRDKVTHSYRGNGANIPQVWVVHDSVAQVWPSHGVRWRVTLQLCSTPLHVATRTGQVDIVEYLLSCDVRINCKDRVGSAPCSSLWPFNLGCFFMSRMCFMLTGRGYGPARCSASQQVQDRQAARNGRSWHQNYKPCEFCFFPFMTAKGGLN